MSQDVTLIIVTYNSAKVLTACLDSMPYTCPILIIDNNSTDNTRDIAKAHPCQPRIIPSGGNLGYGPAANIGLREVKTPYAFILNPDLVFEKDVLEPLIKASQKNAKAALLGPRVINDARNISWPKEARFSSSNRIYPVPFLKTWRALGGQKKPLLTYPLDRPSSVGWVLGCALFFVMERLSEIVTHEDEQTHWFDPNIFLYYEEDDLCLRILDTDNEILWIPDSIITHFEGQSSGLPTPESRTFTRKHMEQSRAYLARKYPDRHPHWHMRFYQVKRWAKHIFVQSR